MNHSYTYFYCRKSDNSLSTTSTYTESLICRWSPWIRQRFLCNFLSPSTPPPPDSSFPRGQTPDGSNEMATQTFNKCRPIARGDSHTFLVLISSNDRFAEIAQPPLRSIEWLAGRSWEAKTPSAAISDRRRLKRTEDCLVSLSVSSHSVR